MGVENVLHMNPGNGEASYANNSSLQKTVILKARQVLEDTMNDYGVDALFPEHFKIADLGCSSGPNTLLVLSNIIDNVHAICQKKNLKAPEFEVALNDLPDNDFNTIFKMLPPFYAKVKKEKGDKFGACFVSGVPGSFYTRLFPCRSLHFVHSSYSLHWLSQVPENLENNKGNIYMSKKSPPNVYEAYWRQYLRDFSTFLRVRSEEVIDNGRMVLTFLGRSSADPTSKDCCCVWELLATSLHDMVAEGLIGEADINSFNIPMYNPCMDEVKAIIQMEGLFILDRVETFEVNWGVQDNDDKKQSVFNKNTSGKIFAKTIRAVAEPMLASHFGNTIIDNVFQRIRSLRLSQEYINVASSPTSSSLLTSLRHPNLFFTIAFILFYFTTTAPSSIPILKKTSKIQNTHLYFLQLITGCRVLFGNIGMGDHFYGLVFFLHSFFCGLYLEKIK